MFAAAVFLAALMAQTPGASPAQRPSTPPAKRVQPAKPQPAPAADPAAFDKVAKEAEAARSADRILDATKLYVEAVALKPDWVEGWWYLGTLLYEQDRYADARDALRSFLALDPKHPPAHALLGLCLFQTREYDLALRHLELADQFKYGGNDAIGVVAQYHLAMLLTRSQQYERALQLLMRYAEYFEDRPALMEVAGIAALRRPLLPAEIPPQDRDVVTLAGRAVWHAGGRRRELAESGFQELIRKYPGTPQVHYLYGSFLLNRDDERSMGMFLKELEVEPRNVPCLVQIAHEHLKRGEPEKGLPYAEKAVGLDPPSFPAHNVYGRILVEVGQLEKGIAELELARKIAPDSPQTRFALGSAYRRAGRLKESQTELAEFERLKKLADAQAGRAAPRAQQ